MKLLTAIAVLSLVGVASANILVPNGDFEIPGGVSWAADGDAIASFPSSGGNGGGYGAWDASSGGWGVFVSNGGAPLELSYFGLGLAPGDTITIEMDMIALSGPSGNGGLKMESWTATGVLDYTADMNKPITSSWETYSWDYTIAAGATHLKFVPLWDAGAANGYDNIGVVPEPATLGLLGISTAAILFIHRRRI